MMTASLLRAYAPPSRRHDNPRRHVASDPFVGIGTKDWPLRLSQARLRDLTPNEKVRDYS